MEVDLEVKRARITKIQERVGGPYNNREVQGQNVEL